MTARPPRSEPAAGKRATSYDVARLAGVSQSMVSRTFTPGASVSVQARDRVLDAARQLNYRPNLIAQSLITQRSRLIAVAIGYMENQFYPAILEALAQAFGEEGYRIILLSPQQGADPDPLLEEILRLQVAAVVLASTRLSSHVAAECLEARVPVVLVNRRTEDANVASVTGQNREGGRAIGEFLLAGGHRQLAYVAGQEDSSTSREREAGFLEALDAAGVQLAHRVVGDYDVERTRAVTRELLTGVNRPDAIFCANDHMAFAVIDTARAEFGLEIGTELSVVGFDDVALAAWPAYRLTTFSQPVDAMARQVVRATLASIRGAGAGDEGGVRDTVAGRLVVRDSARLPTGGGPLSPDAS